MSPDHKIYPHGAHGVCAGAVAGNGVSVKQGHRDTMKEWAAGHRFARRLDTSPLELERDGASMLCLLQEDVTHKPSALRSVGFEWPIDDSTVTGLSGDVRTRWMHRC